MRKAIGAALLAVMALALVVYAQSTTQPSVLSAVAGTYNARAYSQWRDQIDVRGGGSIAAGTGVSIGLRDPVVRLSDGRTVIPFYAGVRVSIGAGAANEIVAITSTTGCTLGAAPGTCTIVVTTANQHGNSEPVTSGSYGLDEAIVDAASGGTGLANPGGGFGGEVDIDAIWQQQGGTSAIVNATTLVYPLVYIKDARAGAAKYWNFSPTGLAVAAPTLPAINIAGQAACDATHQMCSDATVAGSASWGGAVYACWAYVDIFGNEGPCSATTNWTSVASKAIDLGIPAASPGAVGAVPYLSLSGGTYAAAYQIPVTATVCTMTTLETVTPACAVKNTTYNQAGSTYGAGGLFTTGGAQIVTYPVNTSVHFTSLASTVQTTAAYTPMTNSSLTYAYTPSNRVGGCPGVSSYNNVQGIAAGGISASSTAAIPMALATWTIPANCFNYIGAEFRVSGKFTWTEGGTSAATYNVVVGWDANGTDTTTKATALCTIANTHTPAAAAQNGYYSCTVKTLTAGATGTALVNGWGDMSIATGQALLIGFANDTAVAASASLNLTSAARITVQFFDSGNTVTGAQGLENTLEVLN